MKKILLIILAVVVILGIWISGQYNSLITGRANVDESFSNLEGQYQRRSDLVPQLVATVKGAANFEQSTLTAVTEARANATSVPSMPVDPTNAQSLQQFNAAQ
jgi:LemA protein